MTFLIPPMFEGCGPQLLAVVVGTINAISDGMQYGWSAPSIPVLKSENTPVIITHSEEVWLELFYIIGGFLGLPFSMTLMNIIGRKMTIWLSSIVGICGWVCIGAGNHVYYLYVGRLLLGITGDIAFTATPVYISEIAHPKIRGFLAGLIYIMMLTGIVLVYAIGPWLPIYASSLVGASLLLVQILIFPFMPESPYYLIYKNQYDKAATSLKSLRVDRDVTEELREIQKAVERQKTENGRPQDLFLIKSNRKASFIIILLNCTQHFSGISVLIMNLHFILNEAGVIMVSSETAAIMFPSLMLVSAIVANLIMDSFGRKILLATSGALTTFTLLIIAIYFHLKVVNLQTINFSWIPLLAIMVYAFGVKFGLAIVPIVMTAELFPAKVKSMGMALADFMFILAASVSLFLYQWLSQNFGIHVCFYLFGFLCATSTIVILFYVPETKGKTLEEIQMILKNETASNSRTMDTKL